MLSIVIPAYNAERYLRDAVKSVFQTNVQNFEVLIIEDGSLDSTLHIAMELASQSPDIVRIYRHPNGMNLGISASRNLGIQKAKGSIIAFLDADDMYLVHRFEGSLSLLERDPTLDVAYDRVHLDWDYQNQGDINENNISNPQWDTRTITVRKSAFNKVGFFDESSDWSLRIGQDYELWLRMAAQLKIAWTGNTEEVAFYRRHDNNTYTLAVEAEPRFWLSLYAHAYKKVSRADPSNIYLKRLSESFHGRLFFHVMKLREQRKPKEAASLIIDSLRMHPKVLLSKKTPLNLAACIQESLHQLASKQ